MEETGSFCGKLRILVIEEKKDVGRLYVAVHDAEFVHRSQPVHCLNENAPDLGLSEVHLALLPICYHFEEVAPVGELHDQTTSERKRRLTIGSLMANTYLSD